MSNIVIVKSITDSRVLLIGLTTDLPTVFTTLARSNRIREMETGLSGDRLLERLKVTASVPEHSFFTETMFTKPSPEPTTELRRLAFFLLTETLENAIGYDAVSETLIHGLEGDNSLLLDVMRVRSDVTSDLRVCASLLDEQRRLAFLTDADEASWNTPVHSAILNSVTRYETIMRLLGSNPSIRAITRLLNKLFELDRKRTVDWMIEKIKNPESDTDIVSELLDQLRNRGEIPQEAKGSLVASVIDSRREQLLSLNQHHSLIRALKMIDHATLSKWIYDLIFDEQHSINERLGLFQRLGAHRLVDLEFTQNFLRAFGDKILEPEPSEYHPLSQLSTVPVETWLLQQLGDSSQSTVRRIQALRLLWNQAGQDDAHMITTYIGLSQAEPQDLRDAAADLLRSYQE